MRTRTAPGLLRRCPGRSRSDRSPGSRARTPRKTPRDLRNLLWASIDNDDSRDLDQLSVAEALPGDKIKVLVAIADVDAVVAGLAAIDLHARHNTTSVYTAAMIFPMLPEKLSTDITSLGFAADRQAIVVEMVVAADGCRARTPAIYRAWVRNQAKLAYNSVAAWLEGGPRRRRSRPCRGWTRTCACKTKRPSR